MGVEYDVVLIGNSSEIDRDVGKCNYVTKEIKVINTDDYGSKVCKEFATPTLIHEFAHAYMNHTGNNDINNERTAEMMAHFTYFMLSDKNTELIEMFEEKLGGNHDTK